MRCKFCGTTLPEHAKFCPGCGKEIDNARERYQKMRIILIQTKRIPKEKEDIKKYL